MFFKVSKSLIVTLLILSSFVSSSYAGEIFRIRQRSVHSLGCNHQVVEQIYYPQIEQVYYFVGQPLRIESLLRLEQSYNQEITESDRLQQEFKEFQSWRVSQKSSIKRENATINICPTCKNNSTTNETGSGEVTNTTDDGDSAVSVKTLYEQKCSKCHSGNTPKGQLTLTPDTRISLELYKKAIKMIDSGKMPKGGPPLSVKEADQIKTELLGITQ